MNSNASRGWRAPRGMTFTSPRHQATSFSDGLLDWPHYTRPISVDGHEVPEVLASGDHAAIRRWRLKEALGRTWLRRPELLERRGLSSEERALLEEFKLERACFGSGTGRVTDC